MHYNMRRGISMSLEYVVIGFIVLSVALFMTVAGSGTISSSFDIFGEQFEGFQEGDGSGDDAALVPDDDSEDGSGSGDGTGSGPGDGTTVAFGPSGLPCEYIDDPDCTS